MKSTRLKAGVLTLHIEINDEWPFSQNFFDIIISNQVLEHVNDSFKFFNNISIYLKQDGLSFYLFPLKHCVFEGHLHLPFVHRILNWDLQNPYIRFLSKIGFGKYRLLKKSGCQLDKYSLNHADYMTHLTKYLSYIDVLELGKNAGLRTSFRYTQEFYFSKLRSVFQLEPKYIYSDDRSAVMEWLFIFTLKYISGITLFLQKENSYLSK